jgi:hypothetical protein
MQKLNGVFDNRDTMQREAWIDGELAGRPDTKNPATQTGSMVSNTFLYSSFSVSALPSSLSSPFSSAELPSREAHPCEGYAQKG